MGSATSRDVPVKAKIFNKILGRFIRVCNKKQNNDKKVKPKIEERKTYDRIRIATLFLDMDIMAYTVLIKNIGSYFNNDDHRIDILCLQGVRNKDIADNIVKQFSHILKDDFYYAPNITLTADQSAETSLELTWSNSNMDIKDTNIDCVIVSRHPIMNYARVDFPQHHPDRLCQSILVGNINYQGSIISLYNLTFHRDYIGDDNVNIRKDQIDILIQTIKDNAEDLAGNELFTDVTDKHIHIVCGQLNIPEMINGTINKEYTYLFRQTKQLDTYRYVTDTKKIKPKSDQTNIYGTRTSYISIGVDVDNKDAYTIKELTNRLYLISRIFIVDSKVNKFKELENYAVETTFKLDRDSK